MGGAILSAIIGAKVAPSKVIVSDSQPEPREYFASMGACTTLDAVEVAKNAETIFLATKPQDLDALLTQIAPFLSGNNLIISIAAGKTTSKIRSLVGAAPKICRVMPNLAALVGDGMMVYTTDGNLKKDDSDYIEELLSSCGKTLCLEERHFDAVTALSGSGPAFFAYFLQSMAEGGEKLGLSKEDAALLALQTMQGTAKYLFETKQDIPAFIKAVSSPKGTTEAGMKILNESTISSVVEETLLSAANRSKELS